MANSLSQIARGVGIAMEAVSVKTRIDAENAANSKSANYIPKGVEFAAQIDRQSAMETVDVKRVVPLTDKVKSVYDPSHPSANEEGYVTLPDIDPLISYVNLQETMNQSHRLLRIQESVHDLRLKLIRAIGGN